MFEGEISTILIFHSNVLSIYAMLLSYIIARDDTVKDILISFRSYGISGCF